MPTRWSRRHWSCAACCATEPPASLQFYPLRLGFFGGGAIIQPNTIIPKYMITAQIKAPIAPIRSDLMGMGIFFSGALGT